MRKFFRLFLIVSCLVFVVIPNDSKANTSLDGSNRSDMEFQVMANLLDGELKYEDVTLHLFENFHYVGYTSDLASKTLIFQFVIDETLTDAYLNPTEKTGEVIRTFEAEANNLCKRFSGEDRTIMMQWMSYLDTKKELFRSKNGNTAFSYYKEPAEIIVSGKEKENSDDQSIETLVELAKYTLDKYFPDHYQLELYENRSLFIDVWMDNLDSNTAVKLKYDKETLQLWDNVIEALGTYAKTIKEPFDYYGYDIKVYMNLMDNSRKEYLAVVADSLVLYDIVNEIDYLGLKAS